MYLIIPLFLLTIHYNNLSFIYNKFIVYFFHLRCTYNYLSFTYNNLSLTYNLFLIHSLQLSTAYNSLRFIYNIFIVYSFHLRCTYNYLSFTYNNLSLSYNLFLILSLQLSVTYNSLRVIYNIFVASSLHLRCTYNIMHIYSLYFKSTNTNFKPFLYIFSNVYSHFIIVKSIFSNYSRLKVAFTIPLTLYISELHPLISTIITITDFYHEIM